MSIHPVLTLARMSNQRSDGKLIANVARHDGLLGIADAFHTFSVVYPNDSALIELCTLIMREGVVAAEAYCLAHAEYLPT
mgnify:CR=1 FL=1